MQILSIVRHLRRRRWISNSLRLCFPQVSFQGPSLRVLIRRFALWPCCVCALVCTLLLFSDAKDRPATCLIGSLLCALAWIGLRKLRRSRFRRVISEFWKGPFRQVIDLQSRLVELERSLARAADLEQCWETIETQCRDFGFSGGRLRARGQVFETAVLPDGVNEFWQLRIPLNNAQYLNLYRDPEAEDHPAVVGRLAGILRCGLRARCDDGDTSHWETQMLEPMPEAKQRISIPLLTA